MSLPRRSPLDDWVSRLGPETVEEAAEWPSHVCAKLLECGVGQKASALLSHGALCYSDYSGIDIMKEAIRMIVPTLSEALGQPRPPQRRARPRERQRQRPAVGLEKASAGLWQLRLRRLVQRGCWCRAAVDQRGAG